MLLHLGPNAITFRTLLHLGQLLHISLQQTHTALLCSKLLQANTCFGSVIKSISIWKSEVRLTTCFILVV